VPDLRGEEGREADGIESRQGFREVMDIFYS
jgi:hypothetical protein